MKLFVKFLKNRKGAALVEYTLLIAGVALIGAASVSVFGHKTNDLIGTVAAVLPGAHAGDNAPIVGGHLIETVEGTATDDIALDSAAIVAARATERLNVNTGLGAGTVLVVEP